MSVPSMILRRICEGDTGVGEEEGGKDSHEINFKSSALATTDGGKIELKANEKIKGTPLSTNPRM